MKLAFDVAYNNDTIAHAVAISFHRWEDVVYERAYHEYVMGLAPYESGHFYKRELPCIEKLMRKIDVMLVDTIVIDGYVYLDDEKTFGLGAYLHEKLEHKIPVIGVAKTSYAGMSKQIRGVLRGESNQPLFVSAVGMDLTEAEQSISRMAGPHRIPTLLKKLDMLTKK